MAIWQEKLLALMNGESGQDATGVAKCSRVIEHDGEVTLGDAMWSRLVLCVVIMLLASGPVRAAFLPVETVSFSSKTFDDTAFLTGEASAGATITVSGELLLPDSAGPHPLVILLHGSDGFSGNAVDWPSVVVRGVAREGYATLAIDSYGARGFAEIATDQGRVSQFAQTFDAFRAIEALGDDPRIDTSRIVFMGFSRGGSSTIFAALQRFHETYGPASGRIVGYISFYPPCNFQLDRGAELVVSPLRIFHGAADDWASAEVCLDSMTAMAAEGADVELTIYDDARHSFDMATIAPRPMTLTDAESSFACMRVEENGVLINPETGRPFSYDDACVRKGPTAQGNRSAGESATSAVLGLLSDWLGRP